jgi:hypothetical protein
VPERGWGERVVKRLAIRLDPYRSQWHAARWLGGILVGLAKKAGHPPPPAGNQHFENLLRCPDCGGALARDASDSLHCRNCPYTAANEGGVYNLLASAERAELYPGEREDDINFCLPCHESQLIGEWYELEGEFGNKYRWIGRRAAARLKRVRGGPQRLRIRGHAHQNSFDAGGKVKVEVLVNGQPLGESQIERPGLFIFEADLLDAEEYVIEIAASPEWMAPPDDRIFTVSLSRLRLVPRD